MATKRKRKRRPSVPCPECRGSTSVYSREMGGENRWCRRCRRGFYHDKWMADRVGMALLFGR